MKRLALLAFLFVAGCTGGGDDDDGSPTPTPTPDLPGEWTAAAALPGGARQETAVVALDGMVYVLGGFDGGGTVVDDVEVFDPVLGTWSTAAPLPVAMHHANAAVADGKIWVLGYLTGFDFAAHGDVWSYEPIGNAWTPRATMPLGTERGASSVGANGNDIYVAGGLREGGAVADFSVFAATTGTGGAWTGLLDMPANRDHGGGGVIAGIFYAAGGRSAAIGSHVPELLAWDPATPAVWTVKTPMPTSRGGIATAVMAGELFVFGGEGNDDLPSAVFEQTESYDPLTDAWTTRQAMLTPRHGTGAATVGDRIWVPGGADEDAFAAVDTNESFSE